MTTVVRLLGPPRAECDDGPLPVPRGRKPSSMGPVPRSRVCGLLFADAADPQAALRWTLSQARRAVGCAVELTGDPLRFRADDAVVDVLDVLAGRAPTAWPLAEATRVVGPVDREAALREAAVLSGRAVETGLVEFATRAPVHQARYDVGADAAEAAAEARARAAVQDNAALVALAGSARS